jgi:hypothetical protein
VFDKLALNIPFPAVLVIRPEVQAVTKPFQYFVLSIYTGKTRTLRFSSVMAPGIISSQWIGTCTICSRPVIVIFHFHHKVHLMDFPVKTPPHGLDPQFCIFKEASVEVPILKRSLT